MKQDLSATHSLTFAVSEDIIPLLDEALASDVLAQQTFKDKAEQWHYAVLLAEKPDVSAWHTRLSPLFAIWDAAVPELHITEIEEKNWLEETARAFPPFTIGSFYIYGSHVSEAAPEGFHPLLVDANMAFGSGEHATTKGCLLLLEKLHAEGFAPKRILDMGCGSAILAMAAARLYPDATILGADMDAPSVKVAQQNAIDNGLPHIQILESKGYAHKRIAKLAPYDLMFANILANPLIDMAADQVNHLAKDGQLILSGLLDHQEADVTTAYEDQGLKLTQSWAEGEWRALLLTH